MKTIDVLNLEWSSSNSRDRLMATLVCNYLRYQGLNVSEGSIFDGYHLINKLAPKILFLSNSIGAPENRDVMNYANARGIAGISLISEGNFPDDNRFHKDMIWGWNKANAFNQSAQLQWSERTRRFTLEQEPELNNKIFVSGAVGFDNYKIDTSMVDKDEILINHKKKSFKKIIGVGCWDFGLFSQEDSRYPSIKNLYSSNAIERFIKDGVDFDKVLFKTIKANPEILFLLKIHPGTLLGNKATGVSSSMDLDNVLIIRNELSIHECLQIADFWIAYESTTCMEAWLLNKQTCLLNPSGRDFPRDNVNLGSPAFLDSSELLHCIHTFYSLGKIPEFEKRHEERQRIINEIIQWDDGLNHVRAGNFIIQNLNNKGGEISLVKETINDKLIRTRQHTRWIFSPLIYKFKKSSTIWNNRKNFKLSDLDSFGKLKFNQQVNYYNKLNLNKSQLAKINFI